jgi:hypothetical protein
MTGQSELFKNQWTYTQKIISQIDSTDNLVNSHRIRFRRKVARLKYHSVGEKDNKHVIKIKYRHGNTIVRHKYKMGSETKIKVLTINGRQVLIKSRFHKKGFVYKIKNSFILIGDNTWHWIYQTSGIESNTINLEIINNWH